MSLNKGATRRLALLTSSSFVASGVAAAIVLGVGLAPTSAMAQATCVSTPAPTGDGTNAVAYAAGTYNPGIACTYTGTTATVSATGTLTVSTMAPGGGVDLSATGSNVINWNSSAGSVNGSTQTNGPVIEAISQSGAINLMLGAVGRANSSNTITDAVRAQSTSGSIDITALGSINAASFSTAGDAGIDAITGGAGDITVTNGSLSNVTDAAVGGRLRGIMAETTGTGDVTINAYRNVSSSLAGSVGIHGVTNGGLLTINVIGQPQMAFQNGGGRAVGITGGTGGAAILSDSGGDAVINVGIRATLGSSNTNITHWGLDALTASGATTTLNVSGYQNLDNEFADRVPSNDGRVMRIRAAGAGAFVGNIEGRLYDRVDFGGLTGGSELNFANQGIWFTQGATNVFSAGEDRISTADLAIVFTGIRANQSDESYVPDPVHVFDFAGGEDTFDNGGWLVVNPDTSETVTDQHYEGTTRFDNLETFVNSGTVLLGGQWDGAGSIFPDPALFYESDLFYDDVLSLPGAHWVGAGGRVVFDIDPGRTQSNCTDRDANGDLGAADCLSIIGGSSEGVTYVTLIQTTPGDRGRLNTDGIVLVDMAGGESAQGHFVIGPDTPGYSPLYGGVLDKGVFMLAIGYDAETQQHKLLGVPGPSGLQFPLLATAAQNLWRVSTGSWFDRQADLRGEERQEIGGGVWLRTNYEQADRDVLQVSGAGNVTFDVDNSYEQKSYAVTGGADLITSGGDSISYVVGVMAGYAHSDMEYEVSVNTARFDAFTGGIYASLLAGGLFVDAAVNANRLTIDDDAPAFSFIGEDTLLTAKAVSVGAQLEAGWRLPLLADGVFAEPLVGLSYVRTKYDVLAITPDDPLRAGIDIEYDDPTSLRGSLGARLGLDQDYGIVRAQYSLLGRVWEEFEGENAAVVHNRAFPDDAPLPLTDDFSGRLTEVGLGASIYGLDGLVSGFLNLGGKLGDDYKARTGSVGIRVAW